MFGFGITEIIAVLAIAILLFGAPLVRRAGKSLGETVREARRVAREFYEPAFDGRRKDNHES